MKVIIMLDNAQLQHIICAYFGFDRNTTSIGAVSGDTEDFNYKEIDTFPILVVKAEEVEGS